MMYRGSSVCEFREQGFIRICAGFTAASSIMLAMSDTAPPPIHRDNNFDSLRVLAAAMVMLSHSWALFASSFACSFVVAWCSWHVIERPALALKGRASGWQATRMRHASDEGI